MAVIVLCCGGYSRISPLIGVRILHMSLQVCICSNHTSGCRHHDIRDFAQVVSDLFAAVPIPGMGLLLSKGTTRHKPFLGSYLVGSCM